MAISNGNGYLGHEEAITAAVIEQKVNGMSSQTSQQHYNHMDKDTMDPIAIVGFSLTFPEDATSADSFWSMMMEGKCAAAAWPEDRLNGSAFYHPDRNRLDSVPVPGGHFIRENVAAFDAPFFSLSAGEASAMDPQQRKLLETTYRALENAGIPMESVTGSKTSVFTGSFSDDYKSCFAKDAESGSKHAAVGVTSSMLSGRISWFYNFTGTSVSIDTACSSSLVALDLGCQSLRSNAANMSVVTGCNLIFGLDSTHILSNMSMLSPTGRSYSFDHRGDGYGRGEGIGAIILKRLSDAVRDGDSIRAVIRASGSNQDGHTPGITQPSSTAQETLIRETYSKAGLDMSRVRYFEAHGTGTPLGDPLEAESIGRAFKYGRREAHQEPIYVGAVKSAIGHLEGASGIASVIKTILILERGIIPPNSDFQGINPRIDECALNIKIARKPIVWPCEGLRRASVNSFGASGTNSHVVLDDAYNFLKEHNIVASHQTVRDISALSHPLDSIKFPHATKASSTVSNGVDQFLPQNAEDSTSSRVLVLSAADEKSLSNTVEIYKKYLAQVSVDAKTNPEFLSNLIYTLDTRRSLLPWRSYAIIEDTQPLASLLDKMSAPRRALTKPRAAFVFTGQGAQWAGMGRELLKYKICKDSMESAEAYMKKEFGCKWSLIDELTKEADVSNLDNTAYSQPLCTVVQVALVDLLRSIDVLPFAVVGHSSGEIPAAYCAGAFSRESAWKLSYYRGLLSSTITGTNGAMMAVAMGEAEVQGHIDQVCKHFKARDLFIGCINSPISTTITGGAEQVDALHKVLSAQSVFARKLKVDVAYHSPHMKSIASQYHSLVNDLGEEQPYGHVPIMVSTVTGLVVEQEELRNPGYWVQNSLSPVRFSHAIKTLCQLQQGPEGKYQRALDITALVEIGPHSTLQGPIKDTLKEVTRGAKIEYYSCLLRKSPADKSLLSTLGHLHCHGISMNLRKNNQIVGQLSHPPSVLSGLPEYQFNHSKTYWHEGRLSTESRFRRNARLDLLGKPVIDWNPHEARWRNFIRFSELPWTKAHKISDTCIYPAAGMLVMAIEAANQVADSAREISGFRLTDVHILSSLRVPPTQEGIETQLSLRPLHDDGDKSSQAFEFRLYNYENGHWTKNCSGNIRVEYLQTSPAFDAANETRNELSSQQQFLKSASSSYSEPLGRAEFYKWLWNVGLHLGDEFQVLRDVQANDERQAIANLDYYVWPASKSENRPQPHVIHPITLDGIAQSAMAAFSCGTKVQSPTAVPNGIKMLWISKKGLSAPEHSSLKLRTDTTSIHNLGFESSVVAFNNANDQVLIRLEGLSCRFVTGSANSNIASTKQTCFNISWMPDVDLLSAKQLRQFCSSSRNVPKQTNGHTEEAKNKELYSILGNYVGLTTFKRPALRILQTNCSGEMELQSLVKQSQACKGFRSPWAQWLMTSSSESALETDSKEDTETLVRHFDIHGDPAAQGFDQAEFDMLLVDLDGESMTQIKAVLDNASKLLKPLGKLILVTSSPSQAIASAEMTQTDKASESELDLHTSLKENGFSGIDVNLTESLEIADKTRQAIVTTFGKVLTSSFESLTILLILDRNSEYEKELSRLVESLLAADGSKNVEQVFVEDLASIPSFEQTICVFFVEIEHPFLKDISSIAYNAIRKPLSTAKVTVWLGGGGGDFNASPDFALIDGLARVLRVENEELKFISAKFENAILNLDEQSSFILQILKSIDLQSNTQNYEANFLEVGHQLFICRLLDDFDLTEELYSKAQPQQTRVQEFGSGPPLTLSIGVPGMLDTFRFIEDSGPSSPLLADEVEVKIFATGLNFKDLLQALGRVNGTKFGNECAGIIHRAGMKSGFQPGERVCLPVLGAFSTYVRAKAVVVARVPEGISMVEAATIPIQFGTAYCAIHELAHMQKGESILIHSGAGGTGQAAIQLAKLLDAEIFVTVGSESKRKFLVDEYAIAEDHIFYSRSTTFATAIKRMTNGRGVDVVLNSLSGEGLMSSWDCVALYGRFIELGRREMQANAGLPMAPFLRNASFIPFEGAMFALDRPLLCRSSVEAVLSLFVQKKAQPPQPLQVSNISEIQKTMRLLQSGNTMGKFVLEMTDDAVVPVTLDTKASFYFDGNSTYVIAGGLGGLGKSAARWMAQRGAKHLVLLSRSGPRDPDAKSFLEELKTSGVSVESPKCDITNEESLRLVLEGCSRKMPPIRGCIQGTSVLRSSLFQVMSHESWNLGTRSKVQGSWNLHKLLPDNLDFFILLSSISGVVGAGGVANYAAGNSYMDSLAHYRIAHGQKAIALDLGAMVDDGMLVNDDTLKQKVLGSGHSSKVTRADFHALLDYYCDPSRELLTQKTCQNIYGVSPPAAMRAQGLDPGHRFALPVFRHMFQIDADFQEGSGSLSSDISSKKINLQQFTGSATLEEAAAVVCEAMIHRLENDLQGLANSPDLESPLYSFGVDSLLAIELRSWFMNEFGAEIAIFEVLAEVPILTLCISVARKSSLRQPSWVD